VKFEIYHHQTLIGFSHLEFGDPPMGVAFGQFLPLQAYENLIGLIESSALSVHVPAGSAIPSEGGVHIRDHRAELRADDAIEVEVLGVPYPLYQQLFSEHVKAYEGKFGAG
jgi:hypothetical protein